jgi:hypothetical protein
MFRSLQLVTGRRLLQTHTNQGENSMKRVTASTCAGLLISMLAAVPLLAQAPPAPTALDPTNITSSSFQANWDTTGHGQHSITNYRLDVASDAGFMTFVGGYNNAPVTGPYEIVGPVTALQTYYYRLRAVNGSGTSGNSNVISVPIAVPTVARGATNISTTGFTAHWDAVPGVTGYKLDIAKLASFGPVVHASVWDSTVGNVTAFTVAGLTPDTTYFYRVRTVSGAGESANSNFIAVSRIVSAGPQASGTINVPYAATLQFDGTATPVAWTIKSGSLPSGLSLDAGTGTITGTPAALGTFNFTVQVADNTPANATKDMSITILKTPTIAFDAAVGNTYKYNGANVGPTITWNHRVGLGPDRMLIVQVGATSPVLSHVVARGVTYNGKPLTLAKQQSESNSSTSADYISVGQWYLLDKDLPNDSLPHAVVATFADSTTGEAGGSISLKYVKQAPPEVVVSDSGVTNNLTAHITTLSNHAWLINTAVNGYSGGFFLGHNQEIRYQIDNGHFDVLGDTKEVASASADSMQAFHHIIIRMAQVVMAVAPIPPSDANARVRVYLQGPYNTGTSLMNNLLRSGGQLVAHFGAMPIPAAAVDSITIEIRDSLEAAKATKRVFTPAWLLTDGTIRDFSDTTKDYAGFSGATAGNYYIVVRHRNHLAVMSSSPVSLDAGTSPATYDFSTGQARAYGTNPLRLAGTRYTMPGGDGTGDGGVDAFDRNTVWRVQTPAGGYLSGDFNLDGKVDALDVNLIWILSNGSATQVP